MFIILAEKVRHVRKFELKLVANIEQMFGA